MGRRCGIPREVQVSQVIWRIGAKGITVQTFPGSTSELEDTGLVLLTDGYQRLRVIKWFLEPWVLSSWLAMTSMNWPVSAVEEGPTNTHIFKRSLGRASVLKVS